MSNYAVICRTCSVVVWEGNQPPSDGQVLLTQYADNTPCPVTGCPQKTTAINAAKTQTLSALAARIAALEAKVH